jgi:hypothetical protein
MLLFIAAAPNDPFAPYAAIADGSVTGRLALLSQGTTLGTCQNPNHRLETETQGNSCQGGVLAWDALSNPPGFEDDLEVLEANFPERKAELKLLHETLNPTGAMVQIQAEQLPYAAEIIGSSPELRLLGLGLGQALLEGQGQLADLPLSGSIEVTLVYEKRPTNLPDGAEIRSLNRWRASVNICTVYQHYGSPSVEIASPIAQSSENILEEGEEITEDSEWNPSDCIWQADPGPWAVSWTLSISPETIQIPDGTIIIRR